MALETSARDPEPLDPLLEILYMRDYPGRMGDVNIADYYSILFERGRRLNPCDISMNRSEKEALLVDLGLPEARDGHGDVKPLREIDNTRVGKIFRHHYLKAKRDYQASA
jgi:hypothetical protein